MVNCDQNGGMKIDLIFVDFGKEPNGPHDVMKQDIRRRLYI